MVVKENGDIKFSAVESRGLGFNVWRGELNSINTKKLSKIIKKNKVDVAIISIPAARKDLILRLQDLNYPVIFADILIYYSMSQEDFNSRNSPDNLGISFVPIISKHFSIIDELIEDIFHGYQNHYTANPLLSVDIVAAYQEWIRLFASDQENSRTGWILKKADSYIAFLTCDFTAQCCEIVLTGVSTFARDMGVFMDMLNFLINHCKELGVTKIIVSTQLHNYAAQSAYIRKGFLIDRAFITVHINSMLGSTKDF